MFSSVVKNVQNCFREIKKDPVEGLFVEIPDESNMLIWDIWMEGPPDSPFEKGIFQLRMEFPMEFPMLPPTLRFLSEFWHPNVYLDGSVCISILHPPTQDEMSGEFIEERWLPTRSISSIMISIMSMLNDPNINSPANLTASVQFRDERENYKLACQKIVKQSLLKVPSHVKIAHPETDPLERQIHIEKHKGLTMDDLLEYSVEEESESQEQKQVHTKKPKKAKDKKSSKSDVIEEIEEILDDIEKNNLLEIDTEFPVSSLVSKLVDQLSFSLGKPKKLGSSSKGIKSSQISILTFNVLRYSTADGEKRLPHIFDIIKGSQADVIGLIDVTHDFYKELISTDWIKEYVISSTQLMTDSMSHGSLLITKTQHQLVQEYRIPTRSGKDLKVSKLDINNQPHNFVLVQFDEAKSDVKLRIRQFSEISKLVKEFQGDTFLFGDFLFGDKSKEAYFIDNEWKDSWIETNPYDPGYTYDPNVNKLLRLLNSKACPLRRDRIMYKTKGNIKIRDVELLGTNKLSEKYKGVNLWPSDHFAIKATFSLAHYTPNTKKNKKEKTCSMM